MPDYEVVIEAPNRDTAELVADAISDAGIKSDAIELRATAEHLPEP